MARQNFYKLVSEPEPAMRRALVLPSTLLGDTLCTDTVAMVLRHRGHAGCSIRLSPLGFVGLNLRSGQHVEERIVEF